MNKIKLKYYIYSISILSLLCASCSDLIYGEDLETSDAQANFDYLWKECAERYTFFELKDIDWDEVRVRYQAQITDGMDEVELFDVLANMLNELQDGHVNLISNFNVSFFPFTQLGQDNFDWRIIQDNYLPSNYFVSGPFAHDFIAGVDIGYLRFRSFTGTVSENNLGFALERYKDTKGLILDLRENGGGSVSDVYSILRRFVTEEKVVARSRIKSGPGINDFTELQDAIVKPTSGTSYDKKVIVLVDRGTYSAGSYFSLATKELPNLILMGDYTGGGLGAPNGGELPNGWEYRFSITQTLDLNGNNYENGVPPDIEAFIDWDDRTKDEVIERALQELL